MDLKLKSISWVGGIYQKFETLCHEVDTIVNQDTVKYVENQAQNVGKSMKRFYSDVIRTPSKHEAQPVTLKSSATTDTCVESKAVEEEDQVDTSGKLSHIEPVAVDPIEKQLDHASNKLHFSDELCTPSSIDAALKEAESDIIPGQVGDLLENTSSDVNVEENAIMKKVSASEPVAVDTCVKSIMEKVSATDTCVKYKAAYEEDQVDTSCKQSHIEPVAVDPIENQLDHASNTLHLSDQPCTPTSINATLKEAESDIIPGQDSDLLENTSSDAEENSIMEKISASEPVAADTCVNSIMEKISATDTCIKSKAANVEDQVDTSGKLSHIETVAVDPIESQLDHASNKLHLSDQLCTPTSIDALKEVESDIIPGQVSDLLENTSSDVNVEEDVIVEKISASELPDLISFGKEESFAASLTNEFVDFNDENSCGVASEVSPIMQVPDMKHQSPQKEGTINNSIAVDEGNKQLDCPSDELCPLGQLCNSNSLKSLFGAEQLSSKHVADVLKDRKPEVNIEEHVGKPSASEVSELSSPAEKKSFKASLLCEFIDCNDEERHCVESEVFPATSDLKDTKPEVNIEENVDNPASEVSELISPAEKNSFEDSLLSKFMDCNDEEPCLVETEVSPATSVLKDTEHEVNIEENVEKPSVSEVSELISPAEKKSFKALSSSEFFDSNDEPRCVETEVSPATSVRDGQCQQKVQTVCGDSIVDSFEKQLDHAFTGLYLVNQLGTPTSMDPFEVGLSGMLSETIYDHVTKTNSDVTMEENATMTKASASEVSKLISPGELESFGASLTHESDICHDKISCVRSVGDPFEKQLDDAFTGLCLVNQLGTPTSMDPFEVGLPDMLSANHVTKTNSDMNMEENATMTKPSASEVSKFISSSALESFGASLTHESVSCHDQISCVHSADVSPATLVHDTGFTFAQNVRTVKNDFVNDSACVSDASGAIASPQKTPSVQCCEENMEEVGINSSRGSVSKKCYLHETSPENSPAKASLYCDPVNEAGLVTQNVQSSSMLNPPDEMLTVAGLISSSNGLSMESLESYASKPDNVTKSLPGKWPNKNVYFDGDSAQLQALSSSDNGAMDDFTEDISISSMENIELCDEVKLEGSCVIVDPAALCALARIMRKHRSYKKRIQDALTSKKRLAKEYEQLAIWFGDADMGSNEDHSQSIVPSSSTKTLNGKNLQTELVCDSEWELL